jgi:hypothetical protein
MPDLEHAIRQMLDGGAMTFVLSDDRIGRMVITG